MSLLIKNARLVDETQDCKGSVLIEGAVIADIIKDGALPHASMELDAAGRVLTSAFIDLHVHLRDPGYPEKENLESGCLAAAAGGFGSLVCMANTDPVLDTAEAAQSLNKRANTLGLCDVYPVLSLTKGMEGKSCGHLADLTEQSYRQAAVRMLSEDGRDVADTELFTEIFNQAKRLGLPVSCHCDQGGPEAAEARERGLDRDIWSRIEENQATERVLELAEKTGARIHIAHVSTKEAVELIRASRNLLKLSCEVTPHHLALTRAHAEQLGAESFGRVNPPLRSEEDCKALIKALSEGLIDVIATDHAPHTRKDKEAGAPGFTGLESAFAVCNTVLVAEGHISLQRLSSLMSAAPARILGLNDRGKIAAGLRADLCLLDPDEIWNYNPAKSRSRSDNSPFAGMKLRGRVHMCIHSGCIVFESRQHTL